MALILVVEDDRTLGDFLQEVLEEEGYTVERALHGAAALAVLTRVRPQLILCDRRMPVMDGLTFCRHVQADPALATIPIVLSSAGTDDLAHDAWLVDAVLSKPFQIHDLLATVHHAIRTPHAVG